MKKISTIIPNYNSSLWLPKTLDSVLSQNGGFQIEVVVVDDHSTDSSWQILEKYKKTYPEQIFIFKNKKKGGNNARNYGFSKSTGDFIQWLDSDDQLLKGKFEAQCSYFSSQPDADIVYSDWRIDYYRDEIQVKVEEKLERASNSFLKSLILDEWKSNNTYLLRRGIAEKLHRISAWNPNRKVAQDREYFTLAAILGAKFDYIPGVFSVYNRWSTNSVSTMDFKKRLELSLELEKFFMEQIQAADGIPEKEKKKYISLLKTDSLKACFYNPDLTILEPVNLSEIKWNRVHYKMRPFIPIVFLWQNLKYRFYR